MSELSKRDQLKASQELTRNVNPAKKFYKWESENKTFSHYEKENKKNILVDLPFRFVTLGRPLFLVKGFNEKLNIGLYSNEVRTVKDEMTVRYFDKNQPIIAKGVWAEVKEKADVVGGKYHLSIYGYDLQNHEIINIDIKGLGIGEWSELFKKNSQRLADEIVIVNGFKDGKKGNVKFTYPTFNIERVISDDELDEVIDALNVLKMFHKEYLKESSEHIVADVPQEEEEPDLEF
jgi:hypothetical protein